MPKSYQKILLLGNSSVGKTSLAYVFDTGKPAITREYLLRIYNDCHIYLQTPDNPPEFPQRLHPTEWSYPPLPNSKLRFMYSGSNSIAVAPWDTVGSKDTETSRLRPLGYPSTDIVALCFSIGDRESFQEVQTRWTPELYHFIPRVPIVLVGCKGDLRVDQNVPSSSLVSFEEAEAMTKQINAKGYVECSAQTGWNVDHVLEALCWYSLPPPPKTTCIIC